MLDEYILAVVIVVIIIFFSLIIFIFLPAPAIYHDISIFDDEYKDFIAHSRYIVEKYRLLGREERKVAGVFIDEDHPLVDQIWGISSHGIKIYNLFVLNLGPKSSTEEQIGPKYSNDLLRVIIPIDTSAKNKCGIRIDGFEKLFDDNRIVIVDWSRKTEIFNKYKYRSCHLLIYDLERPQRIRRGFSQGRYENAALDMSCVI